MMSEDVFEYVWRIIKADDDEMMRRLGEDMLSDQTHPNECEECGQPGGLSNYPDDSICDDCMSAHHDVDDPDYRDKLNREMGDNDPQNACPSCGSYRYPMGEHSDWEQGFDGATPKDRNNPNPHPLDGMLDESFLTSNEAYSLWDEGYEPDYNSVVEAALNVLEAMGYHVIAPDDEEGKDLREHYRS